MRGRPASKLELGDGNSDEELGLLSLSEIYAAAGLDEDSAGTNDVAMAALGSTISEAIANHCKWRAAEGSVPTMRSQSLIETFTSVGWPTPVIVLARRPITTLASIDVDDDPVDASDYLVDETAGVVRRLDRYVWSRQKSIVVTYTGGFETVPPAIKWAATALCKDLYGKLTSDRDPSVRMVRYEGVGEVQYQFDSAAILDARPLIPAFIGALLAPYVNVIS